MRKDKLHPDAEKALRKLILEIWGFQIDTEDTEEPNEKFNSIWQTADSLLIRSLDLLGFDCIEDFEADVWAKKPKSVPVYEGTGILDLKVTGHKEVSA